MGIFRSTSGDTNRIMTSMNHTILEKNDLTTIFVTLMELSTRIVIVSVSEMIAKSKINLS